MNQSVLSKSVLRLIFRYQEWRYLQYKKRNEASVQIDEVASSVTTFYEKIKGVVDWREEHLLRKRAIERTLKRLILFEDDSGEDVVHILIHELIRGGYFSNESIEEEKYASTKTIIDKYLFILENAECANEKEKLELHNWLVKIASYEIEKNLAPGMKEDTLMKFMTNEMIKLIRVRDEGPRVRLDEEEKNIQIYIATQRALFKIDKVTISYNLLERKIPKWRDLREGAIGLQEITKNIKTIKTDLDRALSHPLANRFFRVCEKYDTPYLIIGDIVADNPSLAEARLTDQSQLIELSTKFYKKRRLHLKGVMQRAAIYSTLSIFITKVVLALLTEIPFDIFVTGQFHYSVLAINILFPPLLMFLLVASARLPGEANMQKVIEEIKKIVYVSRNQDIHEIRIASPKNKAIQSIIVTLYVFTYVLTFGGVIYGLNILEFSIFSIGIFIIFLSTISFLGIKIRERAQELNVDKDKETLWQTIVIFFFFPVVRAGKWLTDRWSGLEIALMITILIDMPFLVFIGFIEQWRYFLREKREEIS